MNSPTDPGRFPDDADGPRGADGYNGEPGADAAASDSQAGRLFADDQGVLPSETRRALVQLLQGPSIDGNRQGRLWQVLLRDEVTLRQQLHHLFLELVVDHDQKVAFTRQIVADDLDAPILLRRASLTFLESVLVLFLRQSLTQADAHGERAVVSRTEMLEHLRVYERDRNVDHARFDRQMDNAVEKAKKLSLLRKLRGGEERFEVSPTLKLLFPAEEIVALIHTYEALVDSARGGEGEGDGGDGDAESASDSEEDADDPGDGGDRRLDDESDT